MNRAMVPSPPPTDADGAIDGGEPTTKDPEHAAAIVAGAGAYPRNRVDGSPPSSSPPLIAAAPDPDGLLQWDSSLTPLNGVEFGGKLERRHSGWEAVERQWIKAAPAQGGKKNKKTEA